jgi:hypothetical protein
MLISETHFTEKSYLKRPNHTVHHTNHHAGTAIIIQNSIKHHQLNNYSQDFLQAKSVSVEDSFGLLTISAIHFAPKHTVKQEQLEDYYNTLGHRFIAGGDYNAYRLEIRTNYTQRTRIIQHNGKKQLKTSIYRRTYILAI